MNKIEILDKNVGDIIADGAFEHNAIIIVKIGKPIIYIGVYAFRDNELKSVTIGDSVQVISEGAFSFNYITSLKIGRGVEYIGEDAFAFNQLTSITIPDSVKDIGERAFSDNKLETIKIGRGVTEIDDTAFICNDNIKTAYVPRGTEHMYADGGEFDNVFANTVQIIGY